MFSSFIVQNYKNQRQTQKHVTFQNFVPAPDQYISYNYTVQHMTTKKVWESKKEIQKRKKWMSAVEKRFIWKGKNEEEILV